MSSDTCPSFQCIGLWLLPFSRVFICQNCWHHLFQRAESTQCWFKESILLQLSRGLQMLGISLGRKKPLPSSAFLLGVKAEGCWMRPRTHHRQWVLSLLAGRVVPGSSESLRASGLCGTQSQQGCQGPAQSLNVRYAYLYAKLNIFVQKKSHYWLNHCKQLSTKLWMLI